MVLKLRQREVEFSIPSRILHLKGSLSLPFKNKECVKLFNYFWSVYAFKLVLDIDFLI